MPHHVPQRISEHRDRISIKNNKFFNRLQPARRRIYIYIYIEREREREKDICIYIYIYEYIERESERQTLVTKTK